MSAWLRALVSACGATDPADKGTPDKDFDKRADQIMKMAELGVMSSTIMHEIRQPLSAIKSNVELMLLDSKRSGGENPRLENLFEAVLELEQMLNSYVEFSRNPTENLRPLTLNVPVERAIKLIRHRLKRQRIQVHQKVGSNLPMVLGNESTLQQVFVNLFVNSIDALESRSLEEKRHIWVLIQRADNQDEVEAFIGDNGAGIKALDADHVFDCFYTTKPEGKGTGLGLAISREIVQAHGGRLALAGQSEGNFAWEPVPNTVFRLTLPVLKSSR